MRIAAACQLPKCWIAAWRKKSLDSGLRNPVEIIGTPKQKTRFLPAHNAKTGEFVAQASMGAVLSQNAQNVVTAQ